MNSVGTVIPALISTLALVLMGVAWWLWRSGPSTPQLPPPRDEPPRGSLDAAEDRFHGHPGLGSPDAWDPPATTVLPAPHLSSQQPSQQPSQTVLSPAPELARREQLAPRASEPRTTVSERPVRPAQPMVRPQPEPAQTVIYAPPRAPETVVYQPPQPAQAPETVVYQPPQPAQAPETVVYQPPQAPETVVYQPPQAPAQATKEPETAVVPLAHVAIADPDSGQEVEPTRVVALRHFDDSPTRIISLHELFADKTQSIPREEILALARAAQATVREGVRAPSAEPASRPPANSKHTRGHASLRRDFETSARSLPPRAWATNVGEPEPEPSPKDETPAEAAAAKPSPTPQPPRAQAPELEQSVLIEHFEGAVEALGQALPSEGEHDLRALAEGPQARWLSSLEVLKLNAELAMRSVLLPTLFDAEQTEHRRFTAAFALLSMKGAPGLLDAIENFDLVCHRVVTSALAHLDDGVRAESIAAMGTAITEAEQRLEWLGVFVSRAVDPGAELVHELLASEERGALAMGLRLLPLHARASPLAVQIDRHLLSNRPAIRSAALIAGLSLGRPSAWMQCKQAARAPDSPEPCLLLATLGTERDRARFVSWAKRAAVPGYVGWALGVSGRPKAISASLELAEGGDDEVHAQAIAGFNLATGADVDTWSSAKEWWDEHREGFEDGRRYLRGEPLTCASLASELLRGSLRWRQALALELLVRSHGELRLPTAFMPARAASLAQKLEELELDFESSYQVRRAK